MLILNSPEVVQETVLRWKREYKIAFVPTMGCLHEGHLKLVQKAKELGQKVVVSIFVNPLQFGPNEDFEKYPRTMELDQEKLRSLHVDLLFAPSVQELYRPGFSTKIVVGALGNHLCGRSRPGHFDGVATVCAKLFQITQPDYAIFGQKDFQQLRIIEQLISDLNFPVTIVAHPTVREPDGLAMSSRNRYLSEEERATAVTLSEALSQIKAIAQSHPESSVHDVLAPGKQRLNEKGLHIEYLEIASEANLIPAAMGTRLLEIPEPRVFAAVKLGQTRLIDNQKLVGDLL